MTDNSRTAIIVALITAIAGILTAVIANIDKFHVADRKSGTPTPIPTPTIVVVVTPTPSPMLSRSPRSRESPTPAPEPIPDSFDVYFQTQKNGRTIYYPNKEPYRSEHLADLSDNGTLYIAACELLPASQQSRCDSSGNWKRLDPAKLSCQSVRTCNRAAYHLSPAEMIGMLSNIKWRSSGQ
jgi:hypothetical protein